MQLDAAMWPVIGLFTELSHVHVTRGDQMCVRHFCRRDVSIWIHVTSRHGVKFADLLTCREDKSPSVTGPL